MLKKVLSMVLCITMLITMLPAKAFATEVETVEAEAETVAAIVETEEAEAETAASAANTPEHFAETTVTEVAEQETAAPVAETEAEESAEDVAEASEETAAAAEETLYEEVAASAQVFMETTAAENSCGEAALWSLEDGVLTISGTGAMADYANETEMPWYEQSDQITSLVISSGITSVGDNAFAGCTALIETVIPESVASIGENAFSGCSDLVVTYKGTVNQWRLMGYKMNKTICSDGTLWDFGDCGATVAYMIVDDTLRIFGEGAMTDYTSGGAPWYALRSKISKISLAAGVTSTGAYAFENCTGVTEMTVLEDVTAIGVNAFSGCSNLVVTYKGTANQWRLMGYKMNKTICSDGTLWDFGDCGDTVAYMIVDDTLRIVGEGAMADYEPSIAPWFELGALFNKLSIEEGVTTVGANAFYYCDTLTDVTIADTVTTIGANAFEGCTGLTTIPLPDSITTINSNAFSGCTGLKHMYIPESVTTIKASSYAYSPFSGCSEELEIYCHVDTRVRGWGSYWNQTAYGVVLTTTYSCDRDNYNYWSTLDKTASIVAIPESITLIPAKAFYNRTTLQNVTIPDTVTTININAFAGCYNLRHLFIPANLTTIIGPAYTQAPFDGTGLTLYCEVREAQQKWDEYWSSGVSVNWGYSRHEYEQWCDLDLNGPEVILPQGIDSIPYRAFEGRSDITMIMIPETVRTIGDEAFSSCSGLTDLAIPEGVETVGEQAFAHCSSLLTVSIPASLTQLPSSAFRGCHNVLSYWVNDLSATFTCDVYGALFSKDMTTLIRVPGALEGEYDIPDSVTTIQAGAFAGCDGLQWIFIPDSVTTIEPGTAVDTGFFDSTDTYLNIYCEAEEKPEGWADNWNGDRTAFFGCSGKEIEYWDTLDKTVSVITIPEDIAAIPNNAFAGCAHLTDVVISEGVTGIGMKAFSGCTGLTKIHIPSSVKNIYSWWNGPIEYAPFYDCSADLEIYVTSADSGEEPAGWQWYWNYRDSSTALKVYYGYTRADMLLWPTVDKTAANIVLPEGIETIVPNAFNNCDSLKSITIPDSVTRICEYAFYDCDGLTAITIPASVTEVRGYAFDSCDNLTITFEGTAQQWMAAVGKNQGSVRVICTDGTIYTWGTCGSNLTYHLIDNKLIISGTGEMENYEYWDYEDMPWYAYRDQIEEVSVPNGLTNIGGYAFYECHSLTSVTIPDGVTSIGSSAFNSCNSLTSVAIPEGVTSIGDSAFNSCSSLTSVNIPEGVTSIGICVFQDCTSLTSITIPKGVTSIGNSTFYNCSSLTSVTIPESVTSIGELAFCECGGLTSVTIPESVTSIGDFAFSGCTSLTSVNIPEGVTSIGNNSFDNCSSLTSVTIPESVTSIGSSAFWGCSSLTSVTIPEGVTTIGESAFHECRKLTGDVVLKNVTSIGDYAFYGCESLTSIALSEGITEISDFAFASCTGLTSFTIPEGVTTIGGYAFCGSHGLTEIVFESSAPAIDPNAFITVTATAYYPKDNTSWTEDVMQNYGGTITWKPHCGDNHTVVNDPAVEATCTETGLTAGTHCSVCDMTLSGREVILAKGHTEAVYPVVEATCTATGLIEGKHCSVCNEVLVAQTVIPAKGHTEVVDKAVEATCTTAGLTEGKHCSVCNEVLTAQEVIPAPGHSFTETEITTAPTCTEPGVKTGKCTVCGETATEPVPALGHTEAVDAAVAPTCTATGLTEGKHCSVCNEILTAQEVIPAKGHSPVTDTAAAPTCTEPGLAEGSHCEVCGEVISAQETIPALGHDFSELEITQSPTCTEEGLKAGTCTRCGEPIEEAVPALGHTEVIDPAVMATCARSGLTEGKHRETCGEVLVARELIPAEGHSFEDGACLTCGAEDKGDYGVFGGKYLKLKYTDPETGKTLTAKQIKWSLPEEYAPYATINAKGKLTAKKVVEKVRVEAIGTILGEEKVQVIVTADIYPAVTQVEILEDEEVVNGKTVTMDVDEEARIFSVSAYPLDTVQTVNWTIGDKKGAYADYTIDGNVLTVTNPTGKAGTVTVKATVNAGAKKTVSFKLNFASFAEKVEITNTEETIVAGSSLKLTAMVTPANVTKSGVTWSLKNAADKAYATISAKGVLKAKTVYGDTPVTVVATSKDGMAKAEYTVTIQPKDTGMLILTMDGENVTKSILNIDLNTETALSLNAENLADGSPAEGITWKSSGKKIATVEDGMVLIHGKGNVTITAEEKVGKKVFRKATVTLKISALTSSITIEEPEGGLEVASGKALKLKATCEDGANKVTWSIVEGSQYAKITKNGKLTANKDITSAKEILIRATAADGSGVYEEATVTIRPLAQGVQIYSQQGGRTLFSVRTNDDWWVRSNTTLEWAMNEVDTLQLSARVYPCYEEGSLRNAMQGVTWKSSSKKIATVDADGLVTCLKPGTVTITATAKDNSGKSVSFKLKVVKKIESLTMEDQMVKGGKSLNLAKLIQVGPADATNRTLTWEITGGDGAAYASINAKGVLKAKKVKTPVAVEITAYAQDGSGESTEFTVTINPA